MTIVEPDTRIALDHLSAFQGQFEKLFLALANSLPELSGSVHALAAPFAALADEPTGVGGKIAAEVETMATEVRAAIAQMLAHGLAGLEEARRLDADAVALVQVLSRMGRASHALRFAGLNATFFVGRLEQRVSAFVATTRALIEVAEAAAGVATDMGALAQTTSAAAAGFGAGHGALEAEVARLSAATEERSRAAMADGARVLAHVSSELSSVTACSEHVAEATRTIMATIQRQDILRQGLDHVSLVVDAVGAEFQQLVSAEDADASSMAFAAFEAEAGRVSAELLRSMREQLADLMGSVTHPMANLEQATASVAEQLTKSAEIERTLISPATLLADAYASMPDLDAAVLCQEQLRALETQVDALGPMVAALEQFPVQLYVIEVSLKSEIERVPMLAGAARIADDLKSLGQTFRALSASVGAALGSLASRAPQMHAAVDRQRLAWESLRTLPRAAIEARERVGQAATEFAGGLDHFKAAGQTLRLETAKILPELSAFEQSLTLIDELSDTCRRWGEAGARHRADLLARGCPPIEAPPTLRALIERFTIFEHKQIALGLEGATTRGEGMANGGPGELTLF